MGPIQQSLNSIATTAMDAIRTKEALASQNEREQREAATEDLNKRVKEQEELYIAGKIDSSKLDLDVQKELFGSRERDINARRVREMVGKQKKNLLNKDPDFFKNMSDEQFDKYIRERNFRAADQLFLRSGRLNSQESYQLSRIFDTMQDMVKGNRYAQQAAIQLSEKIDTALNHMQSRKRWR